MSRVVPRALVAAAMAVVVGCGVAPGAMAFNELGITVSGAPDKFIAGDQATLTATVTNLWNEPTIETTLVANPQWDPFETDPPKLAGFGCNDSIAPPTLLCNLPSLQPGGSTQVQFTASVDGIGAIGMQISANAEGTPSTTNLYSPSVVWNAVFEPKADIKLNLSASAESVANGAPVAIRGLVTNTKSAGTAYGAQVKFSVPPGVEVVSRPADCTGSVLNLACPVGDLAAQTSAERELVLRSTTEGAFSVQGIATWDRQDTTPVDTQGQVTVSVQPPPDTTPATPTPTPTPTTPPTRTVTAPSLARGLPAAGGCVRSRRLTLLLRSRGVWDPIRASIRVTGRKRALLLKGSRAQRPFTVTLPRRGKVKVSLDVTLDNGRRYKATRSFRRC